MFSFQKLKVAGLNILKMLLYVIMVPFTMLMGVYGLLFCVFVLAWIIVVDAAAVSAVFIFVANVFMFFVALFNSNIWNSMGSMWAWLWSWFAAGNVALWPHIGKMFLPYAGSGAVVALLDELIRRLKAKIEVLKAT